MESLELERSLRTLAALQSCGVISCLVDNSDGTFRAEFPTLEQWQDYASSCTIIAIIFKSTKQVFIVTGKYELREASKYERKTILKAHK